jgi:hypothetical protein
LAPDHGSAIERRLDMLADALRVVDEWSGETSGAFVRLTVSDAWTLVDQGAHRAIFQAGDISVELSVIEGLIAEVERGEWSSHYLESRLATTLTLKPLATQAGLRLVWEVRAGS